MESVPNLLLWPVTTAEDVYDKVAYLFANPVAAGLVERGTDSPGLKTTPRQLLGKSSSRKSIRRTDRFFHEDTEVPDEPEEVVAEIERRWMEKEETARKKVAEKGLTLLGAKAAQAQDPHQKPNTKEPRFQLSPNICGCQWKRIELLQQLKSFRNQCAECRARFLAGEREVKLPPGTWGPRILYGARVRAAA